VRLATFRVDGVVRVGVVDGEHLQAVEAPDLLSVLARWEQSGPPEPRGQVWSLAAVELLAPLPRPPRNVFCVGKNYRDHAREFSRSGYDRSAGGEELPSAPVVFTKPPSAVVGPGATIERHPTVTKELDYEAELAVIIGRPGRDIAPEDAHRHVWGYTIVNDVTARDRQRAHRQWFLGKGLDSFCPMGPVAVSADEVDPEGQARPALELSCWVNGELRQQANTADLLFDIPTLIATISAGLRLETGDVIATGTPAGVGIGFDPPRFLDRGDEVTITISGIETLRNRVA
jgi:2-keto-4-pentenoate hydratase/2-oxohepta-3-ene-1,7-dioic acid hydratase in catechol pathway